LSLMATMPRFREMEKGHGSLIRAMMRQARSATKADRDSSGGRYSMFVAPREGVSSLLEALVDRLPQGTVRLSEPVVSLSRQSDGGWNISTRESAESERFDAVVVATQAKAAAELVRETDTSIADKLAAIHHSGCATVTLALEREQIAHPMDGFGFVVPAIEKRKIISGSFSSVKYAGRAPEGKVLVRVFIGGALQAELLDLPDESLVAIARDELAELMGLRGAPLMSRVVRLPASMPQYYVGHKQRVASIREQEREVPGLFLTGNAFQGVGIPFCIRGAEKTAEQVVAYLDGAPTSP